MLNFFKNFDFIAVYETWCEYDCDLKVLEGLMDGFICFTEKGTRVSKHGRPSGGIAVYVKNCFAKFVQRIDAGYKFAVILELMNVSPMSMVEEIENYILVCTYLPPRYSSVYEDEADGVLILKEKLIDLKSRYPSHKLLVCGDLNARIGEMQDILTDDGVDHIDGLDWYVPDNFNVPRVSKDSVVNEFGYSLIDLCTELNIHVLNGRTNGDSTGNYTNITENGCSIVDYFYYISILITLLY